ncbi:MULTISPECIES: hypothetical protein [Streptomyces violaceusniger group]|uniref:Uncharacterized protein n=2 Tax=Streptomyces javensis TaxID=114698 RepID=A0ABN1WFV6_9ACTN|nr:hypothetical protein [Streptomyces javensis]MBI0311878.1 hypothetical protein [Streptomyces javensis]
MRLAARSVHPGCRMQRDERARLYQIDRALVERLRRAFAIADTRLELLRSEPTARIPGPRAHHR